MTTPPAGSQAQLVAAALELAQAAELTLLAWQAGQTPPAPDLPTVTAVPAASVWTPVGVCTHLEDPPYSNHLDDVIAAVRGLKLSWLRCRVYRNDTTQRDAMIRVARETGVAFVSNLGNPWGKPTPDQMITWLATFPPGVVQIVEGPNEPNLNGDPDWAAKTQQWMADLFYALAACTTEWVTDLPVLAPALGKRQGYEELGEIVGATAGNTHIYQGGLPADARLDENVAAEQEHVVPGAGVVTTETGYHNAMSNTGTHRPTSEYAAGVYIPNIPLEYALHPGAIGPMIYELVDEGTNQANQEDCFGLVRNDFTPKPAYHGLAELAELLADDGAAEPTPLALDVTGPADLAYLATVKSTGVFVVIGWRRVSVWDPDTATTLDVTPEPVTFRAGISGTLNGAPYTAGDAVTTAVGAERIYWTLAP